MKPRAPHFGVTLDGMLLHHASGEPVRAGDLVAGRSYRVDLSGRLESVPSIAQAPKIRPHQPPKAKK